MARIIAVCNNKGGVGKTNISVNLPVFLAAQGKKVLLVDFDHQANATFSLGLHPKRIPLSIYHALVGSVSPTAIIRRTSFFGYDLIPASQDLAGAEVELVPSQDRELRLSQLLQKVGGDYDFIFIDSPPSLGLLTVNALAAAQEVLIPVQCEYLALEGLDQLLATMELLRKNLGHDLKITGAVLTMYNRHNKISHDVAEQLRREFPGYVFKTMIPRAVVLSEAPKYGKTILHYAPVSAACKSYRNLAEELIGISAMEGPFIKKENQESGNLITTA